MRNSLVLVRKRPALSLVAIAALSVFVAGCGSDSSVEIGNDSVSPPEPSSVEIVTTNAILGSVLQEVLGEGAVSVIIPNGKDPHDYEPSAQDVAELMDADLIVETGLAYDEGLDKTIDSARDKGVRIFTVSDHVTLKDSDGEVIAEHSEEGHDEHKEHSEEGHDVHKEDHEEGHDEHSHDGSDPHFLSDPETMKQMVPALIEVLEEVTGTDLSSEESALIQMFEATHADVLSTMSSLGDTPCKLVTGHKSMRYFADRYECEVVGAIIPGASSTAEATAGQLADLKTSAQEADVRAIFVDEGTPSQVANQIASEIGVGVFQLPSHTVPNTGGYKAYVVLLADVIVEGLTTE